MNKRYDQEAAVAIRYPLSAFPPPTVILSEAKDLGKNCI